MLDMTIIQKLSIWALPILFAITLHEVAHGWVASKCGDQTARLAGRLTLNPAKHIDLVGTILIPGIMLIFGNFIFGWAKPVPVDYRNLRHPKIDGALVAAAGPVSNLLMALIWAGIAKLGLFLLPIESWFSVPLVLMARLESLLMSYWPLLIVFRYLHWMVLGFFIIYYRVVGLGICIVSSPTDFLCYCCLFLRLFLPGSLFLLLLGSLVSLKLFFKFLNVVSKVGYKGCLKIFV